MRRRHLSAGAEPLYVPALKDNGFLPDFAGLAGSRHWNGWLRSISARRPIPKARWQIESYWEKLFALAERHDFIVLADECYADIYFDDQPPASALPARLKQTRRLSAGCSPFIPCPSARVCRACVLAWWRAMPALIEKFRAFRNVAGPTDAGAIAGGFGGGLARRGPCRGATAPHMPEKMAAAGAHPGRSMSRKPAGGFFLWLEVGNGEE